MDSVPRTQADALGIPLLEGLGGAGDESQVVWRSGGLESLTLVHSYNLPPPPASQQEIHQQEAARLLMDQTSQQLVQQRSQPGKNLRITARAPN